MVGLYKVSSLECSLLACLTQIPISIPSTATKASYLEVDFSRVLLPNSLFNKFVSTCVFWESISCIFRVGEYSPYSTSYIGVE